MSQTIFAVLRREHKDIARLLRKADSDPRRFSRLAAEISAHMQTEEDVLYAPLRDDPHLHGMILEAFAEHHMIDLIVREIERSKTGTDEWHAKLKVMRENLEHHIEEEEEVLFPSAERILGTDRAMDMTGQYEATERDMVGTSR